MTDNFPPTGPGERPAIAIALLALAASIAAGCSKPEAHNGNSHADAAVTDVVSVIATTKPLGLVIEAVGTARANESVDVTSKASNIVAAIRFEDGDSVRKGSVLVELDATEAQAALAEAEAALAESENQYKRSRDLYSQQALSVAQLDLIEATLKGNRARVGVAKARLEDTLIRAGFDGRTGFRRVSVGGLVSPGTVVTTLDDTSVIKLDFTVPETYLYALERGLPVTATTVGLPGKVFQGAVSHLDSRVDPVTRSITVRAELPNRNGLLRPGMFMTVTLRGEETSSLLVPEEAIVPEQGKAYVFAMREGVAERREVRLGKRRPGEVEIVSGLAENERVIIEGTQNIRDGSRVRESPSTVPPAADAGTASPASGE
jgi:membrane fusion protein (multidrug efflux system)